jgi:sigma-54 dependent transcriptional regulator, acetoin dehydrogenase operon transcriptional activator AcoR
MKTLQETRDAADREALLEALRQTDGNGVHAAQLLGISRATLGRLVKRLGVAPYRGSNG